jgi:hypothetical protein
MFLGQIEWKDSYRLVVEDYWFKVYDEKGNLKYYETSKKYWAKWDFDEKGNELYYEDSDKYWAKYEYDEQRNEIYFETSNGTLIDKRVKKMTLEEIEKVLGYKVEVVK